MLLKSEIFHYDTSLDLNMVNYHIKLRENATNLCTIILPWGKYCYQCLTMGVVDSLYNFQQKMNDLFRLFSFIRAYIYKLLVSTKGDRTYHVKNYNSL